MTNERIEKSKIRSDGSAFSSRDVARAQTPENGLTGNSNSEFQNYTGSTASYNSSGIKSGNAYGRNRAGSDLGMTDLIPIIAKLSNTGYSGSSYGIPGINPTANGFSGNTSTSSSNNCSTQNINAPGIVKYNSTNSNYSVQNDTNIVRNSALTCANLKSIIKSKINPIRPKSERDINPLSFSGPQTLGSLHPWGGVLNPGVGGGGFAGSTGSTVGARVRSQSHEVVTLTLSNPSLNNVNLSARNYAPRLSCQYADSEVSTVIYLMLCCYCYHNCHCYSTFIIVSVINITQFHTLRSLISHTYISHPLHPPLSPLHTLITH